MLYGYLLSYTFTVTNKKITIVLIGLIIFIIAVFAVLFYLQKNNIFNISNEIIQEQQTPLVEPILFKPNDPATMAVSGDQNQVTWTIEGQFIKPFTPKGDFYIGYFVVMGDTSKQELPIWIGPKNTPILLSTPTTATESSKTITWKQHPLETINDQVGLNQPVKIYIFNQITKSDISHITKLNNFWLTINNQIQREGKITLPDDMASFWLYTNKVGL